MWGWKSEGKGRGMERVRERRKGMEEGGRSGKGMGMRRKG